MTGAAGSIGRILSERLSKMPVKKLILLDQDESGIFEIYEEIKNPRVDYVIANIREETRILSVFHRHKPDIVIHAAAYKHVVLMERFPEEARKTNVFGTINVINAAIKCGTQKFVLISTDKAVNPVSVMGNTKALAEDICLSLNGKKLKTIVVRFGNVMASRGSIIPIFKKQILENKSITITDQKMRRYFMGIHEAADLILEATVRGKGGEIFILDMKEEVLILDLAKLMLKLEGKDLPIKIIGRKKGEKISEELMTKKEKKRAKKVGKLYVIK